LIDDAQNLSMPGLLVLTLGMREQQAAAARWRAESGARAPEPARQQGQGR
jgi:hypothetical protein